MEKYAALDLSDNIYNWLVNFFCGHSHCTRYCDQTSALLEISASIVQGSAIGPISYVVTAADLDAVTPGNKLCKYTDDTYVIIPASNVDSRLAELDNVMAWSRTNNLTLNRSKSVEIVFTDKRHRQKFSSPPVLQYIERVTSLKILGVPLTDRLSMSEHVQATIIACASLLYALRVLRAHGMPETALQTVYQATVMAKVLYGTSAWWGFTSASDRQRIEAFVGRAKRCGLCQADLPPVTLLVEDADDKLFEAVLRNPEHTLHSLLPERRHDNTYSLRPRRHDLMLSRGSYCLTDCNFIIRQIFKDSY